jgi:hypothetical protein
VTTTAKLTGCEWRPIEIAYDTPEGDTFALVQWDGIIGKWLVNGDRETSFDDMEDAKNYVTRSYAAFTFGRTPDGLQYAQVMGRANRN